MLKPINLISLANALTSEISETYTNYVGIEPKKQKKNLLLNYAKNWFLWIYQSVN